MKNLKLAMGCLCISLAMGACAKPEKRTAIGAGAGAAAGAAMGGAAKGGKGALIGGAAGAAVGGAIGNYLDKQHRELAKVADAQRTRDGILVKLKNDLLFDTGKTDLKGDARSQLNELGDILAKYDKDRIRINGFTDNVGSDDFNKDLSVRRAKTVEEALASRGVRPDQMSINGYGESSPVASNSSSSGREKNRRVELKIDVPAERGPATSK